MKNLNVFLTAFLLSLSLIFIRCTPDAASIPSTEEILVRSSWSVDYYFHGQDMTSEFGNSTLLFSNTGVVGYQKNGETIAGTWNKTVDASNNEVIAIHFNTTDVSVSRLNESWKIADRSSNSLQMEENNGTTNILFRIKRQ
jgi:hypothetical protein